MFCSWDVIRLGTFWGLEGHFEAWYILWLGLLCLGRFWGLGSFRIWDVLQLRRLCWDFLLGTFRFGCVPYFLYMLIGNHLGYQAAVLWPNKYNKCCLVYGYSSLHITMSTCLPISCSVTEPIQVLSWLSMTSLNIWVQEFRRTRSTSSQYSCSNSRCPPPSFHD